MYKNKLRYIKEVDTIDTKLTEYLAKSIQFIVFSSSVRVKQENQELREFKVKASKLLDEIRQYLFKINTDINK